MLQPLFLVTDPLALLGIPVHGVVILFQVGGVTVSVFFELELCVLATNSRVAIYIVLLVAD